MFIDTHCHLNFMIKKNETHLSALDLLKIEHICKQADVNNVKKIINVGSSLQDSFDSVEISKKNNCVWAVVGIHPYDCTLNWKVDFNEIKKLVDNKKENKIVGIGESGLDFYRKPFNLEIQNAAFKSHIELAIKTNLPLVIHVREAGDESLKILEEYIKDGLKGIIHCFSQNQKFLKQILEWGFYVGIGGYITYPKNETLREIVKYMPLDRLLLETDAPFLPPQQFRGKINSPAYIPLIAQFIANLKNINLDKVEEVTTQNAIQIFQLGE